MSGMWGENENHSLFAWTAFNFISYYYSFTKNHMKKDANSYTTEYLPWIVDTLSGNMLYLDTFENSMGKKDAIVTYVKK